jgi:N-methylhydantoinase A
LFAFGGAGPMHAFRVAEKLGVKEVIMPFGAGVGSTIGLLAAPLAFDFVRTATARVGSLDWDQIAELLGGMEQSGRDVLTRSGVAPDHVQVERSADMRLIGQAHEITVGLSGAAPRAGDESRLEREFESAYTKLYGRTPPGVPLEVVSWRVRLSGPEPELRLAARQSRADGGAHKGQRAAYFSELGGFHETPVYDRYRLVPGTQLDGPAIIEERESTAVVGPNARACVDDSLNLIVELGA